MKVTAPLQAFKVLLSFSFIYFFLKHCAIVHTPETKKFEIDLRCLHTQCRCLIEPPGGAQPRGTSNTSNVNNVSSEHAACTNTRPEQRSGGHP